MSEITKLLAASGLLAAGFFSASLFGTPDAATPASTAPGEWTPQQLEPLESAAQLPTTASALWDDQVAQAAHSRYQRYEQPTTQSSPNATHHAAARATWPNTPSPSATNATASIPEIGSAQPSQSGLSRMDDDWPPSIASSSERVASLAPPALLDERLQSQPMRPSQFPSRPSAPAPSIASDSSTTTTHAPATNHFDAPLLQPAGAPRADDWTTRQNDRWPPTTTAPEVRSMPITNTHSEPIWHVVSDGDSLPRLAERYLGDASRARDIYELNRDVLMSPDLLRIGEKLRIPQNQAKSRQFEVFDANGSQAGSFQPQSKLVPLPELPDSVHAVPRARLQGPVSANLSAATNSYGP